MSLRRAIVLASVGLLLLTACAGEAPDLAGGNGHCTRPPAKDYALGSTLTITGAWQTGCRLEVVPLGVTLGGSDTATSGDIAMPHYARDGKGQYYTSNGYGQVTVWSPQGAMVRTIGRQGEGPGEFPDGALWLLVDPADNLYALDRRQLWSILAPDGTFLGSFRQDARIGFFPWQQFFLEPFVLLSAEGHGASSSAKMNAMVARLRGAPAPEAPPTFFGIYDFRAALGEARARAAALPVPQVRAFGAMTPFEVDRESGDRGRLISAPVDGAFWAGPPKATGRGYELQQWGVDGTLRRTIRREVPWFVAGADVAPPAPDDPLGLPSMVLGRKGSELVQVRDDGTGLLYVAIMVTNDQWDDKVADGGSPEAFGEMLSRARSYYYEVLDTRSGAVLASEGPITGKEIGELFQVRPAPEPGWKGIIWEQDDDGLTRLRMVELRLVPKS